MRMRLLAVTCLLGLGITLSVRAQAPILPPGEKEPLLRLEAGGPTSFVTSLAFSPDGKLLYVGGWDKVVRVWSLERGQFVPTQASYRVPIGPGLSGAVNCIALSPDGKLLAVAGRGVLREEAGFRVSGLIVPSVGGKTVDMRRDEGIIYLFDTRTQAVRLLRGHAGDVLSMAFAPGGADLLVSAAVEKDEENKDQGVLRVWNAATGETLAINPELPYRKVRPSLAVWRSGQGAKEIQVGFAWGDGNLRIWDVAKGAMWKEVDGAENVALQWAQAGEVITGSSGRLKVWQYSPTGGLELQKPQATFPAEGQTFFFPRAVSLVPSEATAKPNLAAVILWAYKEGAADEYRLNLVDLNNFRVAKEISLWKGLASQPVLAASSLGYLAIAGNSSHDIRIYFVKNLLADQTQPQIIRSVGSTFRYVSFVSKGKDLGLLLSETTRKKPGQPPRDPQQGDLIFDFSKQPLSGDIREWKTAAPAAEGWQARASVVDKRAVVSIFQDQNLVREIKLAKDLEITDHALLAPRPPLDIPLLAVASHDSGQPMLQLYNGKTGEQLRQLTSHADFITGLAFSPDGRLLASVADDQSVCVWSLNNLDKIVEKIGLLPGLAVKDQGGKLVVGKIYDDSPLRGKFVVGEIVEGLVEKEKLRSLKSASDFYFAIAKIKPGTQVILRVRGQDGLRDVALEVRQGIDERKPLFSLFVTKADRQWVGWNPIGRFESSGPKAEAYVGWHFNTGDPAGPTRFALAEEYHKKYYQEGVLKDLIRVDQGEIKKLPSPPPPPPPKLGLLIEEEGLKPDAQGRPRVSPEADAQGRLLLRHPKATLRIAIIGRAVDTLKSISWKMDDGPEQNLDLSQVAGQEIAVPLELRRGVHRLRVTAKTPSGEPGAEYFESVTLRYQPPAPQVKFAGERTILVKDPTFDLSTQLQAGASDESVKLKISHKTKDNEILNETKIYKFNSADPLALTRSLRLEKGRNLVEITAVNQGAADTDAEEETSRVTLEINYFKEAGPPVIALRSIRPLNESPAAELPIELGRPIHVNVPSVRIVGEIKAGEDEDLEIAAWALGKEAAKHLSTFETKKKSLPINEKVRLKPGPQVFRFLAKTASSPEEERTVTIDYQPLVPQVAIISPRNGSRLTGGDDSKSVELQVSFGAAPDPQPFKPTILVNDRELDVPAQINQAAGMISATVALKPGTNLLRVKLSNDWGGTSTSEEIAVRYLRPPIILSVKVDELKEGVPFASLQARIKSATPLVAENVQVFVNESERKAQIHIQPEEGNVWAIRLTAIPLDANAKRATTNNIKVRVSNAEAEAEKEGSAQVVYQPKQPPPIVEFTQPVDSVSVTRPDIKVQFQVRSETELAQVKLMQEKHEPVAVDVSKAEAQPGGGFLLTAEVPLKLDAGPNTLRIEALNKGGVQETPPLEVNYLYRPVRVAIDSLVAMRPGAKPEKADLQSGGAIVTQEGRLRLSGRVLWDEADDQRLKNAKMVRVYVNGFQQLPALLDKPTEDNPRQRTFQTSIVLNRDHGNHIEITLPDLEKDINNRLRLIVDCGRPERSQRLHLLIVSMPDKDPKPLERQIRQAFQTPNGAAAGNPAPRAAAFDPIYSYPSLVDYRVKPSYVYYQLVEIKNTIQRLSQIGAASSDVVAVYYRGGEAVSAQGNLFQTSLTRPGRETRESAITCDEVVGIFSETPGAQILLMDVDRQPLPRPPLPGEGRGEVAQDQIISWGEHYPRVGILHYAWLGQPNAPKNPDLIQAIEKAMGQATRLVEVRDGVRRLASSSPDYQKKLLVYDAYLPPELEDLSVR